MSIHGDFGNGSVKKHILKQSLPLMLAQLVQLLYNIVDRIYLGHMPGADADYALTGVGLCFPIITFVSALVNWISSGAAPLCSIARGNGEKQKAQDLLSTAFSMLLAVSLSATVLLLLFKTPALYALGASDETIGYATDYMNIYLWGTVFFAIGTGMNSFINLQGYPKIGMLTTVLGAVLNLILDPIFIFVLNMGVKGAAIATVISQFVSALWVLSFLAKKNLELNLSGKKLSIKGPLLKKMLVLGIPGLVMGATNSTVQAVCNKTLSIYGGDAYVAVMTIINSVREIGGLPINGITGGSQPVISYNYGAQNYKRVKQGIKFMSWAGICYTAVFWISTLLLPKLYLRIFSSDLDIIEIGITPMMIYFMGFIFMSLQFSGQSSYVALSKAKQAIFFSIFRKIIIVVPLTIFLPRIPSLGVYGVFAAEPISNLVGGFASFLFMYFTVYRRLPNSEK